MRKLSILTLSLLLCSILIFSGCEDNCNCYCGSYDALELRLNDTLELKYSELYCNQDYEIRLSFDSLSDSRCPVGAVCFWEGNASFSLIVKSGSDESNIFSLNTNGKFRTDTVVNDLHYELIDVLPYPKVDRDYSLDDYILIMYISD